MYQQYLNSAQASLHQLSSDELKELLNDDDKLEEKINESVSNFVFFMRHYFIFCSKFKGKKHRKRQGTFIRKQSSCGRGESRKGTNNN